VSASSLLVEPAFRSVPAYDQTLGPEVADLNALAGFEPDADQRMILDAIFGIGEGGRSAAFETAIVCCRQNLKTGVKKQAALGWLFLTGERLVVWSAHEWDTVKEAFRDLDELITGSDFLRRRVKHIYRGNGDEAIELLSGARLIFKTRTKGGGRGLSGRKVILDEAMFLRAMHMGALLPQMSAQPDPQVLYGGSAGLAESDMQRGVRDRGRAGNDPRLAYFEWCAPPPEQACESGDACTHALTTVGCGCDNPKYWQMANPAMGRRITAEYIAAERRALPPHEFGRERMGWWDGPAEGASPLDYATWGQRADPSSAIEGTVAFGFEIRPDLSSAAIAVAGRRADGLNHGEVVEYRPGTAWLTGRILELAAEWKPCVVALNASGQSSTVTKELAEQGFEIVTGGKDPSPGKRRLAVLGAREWAQACGALVKDVANDRWRHLGQAPADTAVEGARTRVLEDAYAWSHSRSPADITPLGALTAARHGFMTYGVGGGSAPFALWG
jgi:hypothetical protein